MNVVKVKYTAPSGTIWQLPLGRGNWQTLYRAMRDHREAQRGHENGKWSVITSTGDEQEITQ